MQPAWSGMESSDAGDATDPQVFGARVEHGVEPELGE